MFWWSTELNDGDKLVDAAGNGNVEEVTRLLNNGVNIDGFSSWKGRTPLTRASINGKEAVVQLLLSRGANANLTSSSKSRSTALMYACYEGHVSVAELLLRNGADHTLKDTGGKTALEMCRDSAKRTQLQAVIYSLAVTPAPSASRPPPVAVSTPAPTPALPTPSSTTASNSVIKELRAQLAIMSTQLAERTRETESMNTQLQNRISERDQIAKERDAAVADRTRLSAERDSLIEQLMPAGTAAGGTAAGIAASGTAAGYKANSCAFERYRPHMFVPSLVPCCKHPGIHDVSEDSALFRTCRSLCNVGGSWLPTPGQIAGFRLVGVQAVVHEEDYYRSFDNKLKRITQQRQNGGDYFNSNTGSMNASQLLVLSALRDQFVERAPGTVSKGANSFYCYHGPRAEHVVSICTTGMVATRAMDAGFFGCGCYTTLNMEYAARYARGDFDADDGPRLPLGSRYPVIMFAATTGMAYPLTPADYGHNLDPSAPRGTSDFFGKPLKPGFDSHVICVSQASNWQAVERNQCQYVEVVIDQQDQLLPVAVLWFEDLSGF